MHAFTYCLSQKVLALEGTRSHLLLSKIAKKKGGKLLPIDTRESWKDSLPNKKKTHTQKLAKAQAPVGGLSSGRHD